MCVYVCVYVYVYVYVYVHANLTQQQQRLLPSLLPSLGLMGSKFPDEHSFLSINVKLVKDGQNDPFYK